MDTVSRSKIKDLLNEAPGKEVLAKGWVRTKRGNRQVKFIALNDGSTINNIQVVAETEKFDEEIIKRITTAVVILLIISSSNFSVSATTWILLIVDPSFNAMNFTCLLPLFVLTQPFARTSFPGASFRRSLILLLETVSISYSFFPASYAA